jgi:hypothetical protein
LAVTPGHHHPGRSTKLAAVFRHTRQVTGAAQARYAEDLALAQRFGELLGNAAAAEQGFRHAEARGARPEELYPLARRLDTALTEAMRAAYATQRVKIGVRGYEDRIYRRKALATPAVRVWTTEAERLLTLRETHRLRGVPPVPRVAPAGVLPGPGVAPGRGEPAC